MSQQSKRKYKKHPWYKRKGYLHLDLALSCADAEKWVTNPSNIMHHRFSPLIHYGKTSRKVQRDKTAEKLFKQSGMIGEKPKLLIKEKTRNIFYTSHIDGYIYSYYGCILQRAYEAFLSQNFLQDNVIAYRAIKKQGVKFCNSHLAKEVFDFIKSTNGGHILCFDISSFFDKLSPQILKSKWMQILNKNRLPDDHFKLFESLTEFRYIEEGQLINNFKNRFAKNPRQHGLVGDEGGSLNNRICSYEELVNLKKKYKKNGTRLLKNKNDLQMVGIPQGTPLSGLLSNIFMTDFDVALKEYAEKKKGMYRRYSDDIIIVIPSAMSFSEIELFISQQLKICCGQSIQLNDKKTERKIFITTPRPKILDIKNSPSRVQYLGFHFDGKDTIIRTSSISKDRGMIIHRIRKHKKRGGSIRGREVYKERSTRQITPFDNKKTKGYVYYAERAGAIHDNSPAIMKQIKKEDRFIKRAMLREKTNGKS